MTMTSAGLLTTEQLIGDGSDLRPFAEHLASALSRKERAAWRIVTREGEGDYERKRTPELAGPNGERVILRVDKDRLEAYAPSLGSFQPWLAGKDRPERLSATFAKNTDLGKIADRVLDRVARRYLDLLSAKARTVSTNEQRSRALEGLAEKLVSLAGHGHVTTRDKVGGQERAERKSTAVIGQAYFEIDYSYKSDDVAVTLTGHVPFAVAMGIALVLSSDEEDARRKENPADATALARALAASLSQAGQGSWQVVDREDDHEKIAVLRREDGGEMVLRRDWNSPDFVEIVAHIGENYRAQAGRIETRGRADRPVQDIAKQVIRAIIDKADVYWKKERAYQDEVAVMIEQQRFLAGRLAAASRMAPIDARDRLWGQKRQLLTARVVGGTLTPKSTLSQGRREVSEVQADIRTSPETAMVIARLLWQADGDGSA